jgi:MscS family membrane protein
MVLLVLAGGRAVFGQPTALPDVLLRPGPGNLLWWQWAALPFVVLAAWMAGRLLAGPSSRVARRLVARSRTPWDDLLLARLASPVRLLWSLFILWAALPVIALGPPAESAVRTALGTLAVAAGFFLLWRSVDVMGAVLREAPLAVGSPSTQSLLSIGVRAGKVGVLSLGVIAALSMLGYPVASLLAGLGIGGLAVALAAQKTLENVFGSVALGLDQPVRVGDFVKVEDFVGTVEAIGLRSTRFRTLDRTLISIPNARLADMRLESYTARDRLRLACVVGLVYETSASQMRQVLAGLEAALRDHPKIWPDAVVVRFKELAASSLDIEVMAWFQTSDWSEFQLIRQEILLRFMEVVEAAGTGFAYPTRTLHIATPASTLPRA